MGEVYRAHDEKLNRDVAIKVLPVSFSQDEGRLRRFEQEAKAAGALNHPNILAVYDVGAHDGMPYVVSELLEGETLRWRLTGSPLAPRQVIDYALQIVHGLAAAHEKEIIHRDLKPENIFITNDGRVKILDFGLAKLVQADGGEGQTDISTRRVDTEPGVVMGTVGYMSPEQVRGQRMDQRSDLFSFGCVLYEMLSGRRAFKGESSADTLSAILKEDPPDLSEISTISPTLMRVMRHCLEKNPLQRFQSTKDLAFAIESLLTPTNLTSSSAQQTAQSEQSFGAPKQGEFRRRLLWLGTGTIWLVAILAIGWSYFGRALIEHRAVQFSVALPAGTTPYIKVELHNLSISPDGTSMAFIGYAEGQRLLWVRDFDSLSAQALAGTEGAFSPFWSPDSSLIAFFAEGKLKKIARTGGASQTVCDVAGIDNVGTWGSDGTILFSGGVFLFGGGGEPGKIYRVPASGGQASLLLKTEQTNAYWFAFLPDGKHFLYYGFTDRTDTSGIYVASLDSSETRLLLPLRHTRVEYSPPGYLLYVYDGTLMAHPFDAVNLRFTGEPRAVAERVSYFSPSGWTEFSVAQNGVLVYLPKWSKRRLAWFDRSGREIGPQLGPPEENLHGARLSPDGKKVAFTMADSRTGLGDLWIHDLLRGTRTRFTSGDADDDLFVWSPDGRRATFFSAREDESKNTLHIKDLTDSGEGETPLQAGFQAPQSWSPDGRFILYVQNPPTMNPDLWVLPLFGERKPFPLLQSEFREGWNARFSPDGRWVAFESDESGQGEIYVARFDNPRDKWRISTSGAGLPRWRHDGKELFYVSSERKMMSVPVKAGEKFDFGAPTPLFTVDPTGVDYDVSPDGQRFLGVLASVVEYQSFNVVIDWPTNLKR
jgi:serine/threonine protein kinase/Tol biopolymer transport system component